MSDSKQTSLRRATAEELAGEKQQVSIADFFAKNKQMLGFDSPSRALVTAVKEGVDNSLDAAEESGILPAIRVIITKGDNYYNLTIEDNGPGITKSEVPKVFGRLLYGSRFHKREQHRGQQGIGISAAVLYSQMTSGKPARITTSTKGSDSTRQFDLMIDTDENEAEIKSERDISGEESPLHHDHGTAIELEMEANMRGRTKLHNYIRRTAVVNPHAEIVFEEPKLDEQMVFDRTVEELPPETSEIAPHPHGVDLGEVMDMLDETGSHSIRGFLQQEFVRVGGKTADEILDKFRDKYYGREGAWTVPEGAEDALISAIRDSVANKKDSEEREFAKKIATQIIESDYVSRTDVGTFTNQAAEEVEDGFTTRFGSTVRSKAADAAWSVVAEHRGDTLEAIVKDATSDKKDPSALKILAQRLRIKFEQIEDRDRATKIEVENFVDEMADTTEKTEDERFGETARENITNAVWAVMKTVDEDPPKVRNMAGDREASKCLRDAMLEANVMAPPSDCLSPIGEDNFERGLQKVYSDAEFYATETRDASVHGGDPFIAEAGIAYGEEIADEGSAADILRFANRVPLVYQRGACAITDVVKDIGWRNYKISHPSNGLPQGPLVIAVHVASTNVPFTSESKDAVANVEAIEAEVERAIRGAARDLKDHLKKQRDLKRRREKKNVIGKIIPKMAEKLSNVTGREVAETDRSTARIMNDLFIRRKTENGSVSFTVINHSNSGSVSPTITATSETEPTGVDTEGGEVAVQQTDDGMWELQWQVDVGDSEKAHLAFDGDPAGMTVNGVPDEITTIEK